MKLKEKNPLLKETIGTLHKKTFETKEPVWKSIAKGLNRSNKQQYQVNLYLLEKHADDKKTIVVPGAVLGTGSVKKPLNIAALKFSVSAKEKIKKAGGSCFSIEELMKKQIKPSEIQIVG